MSFVFIVCAISNAKKENKNQNCEFFVIISKQLNVFPSNFLSLCRIYSYTFSENFMLFKLWCSDISCVYHFTAVLINRFTTSQLFPTIIATFFLLCQCSITRANVCLLAHNSVLRKHSSLLSSFEKKAGHINIV